MTKVICDSTDCSYMKMTEDRTLVCGLGRLRISNQRCKDFKKYESDGESMANTTDGVIVGQKLKVMVVGRGSQGDPIAKYKGLVIFIKNTNAAVKKGDYLEIEITEVKPHCAMAKPT